MKYTRENLHARLYDCMIPTHMHDGIIEWILNGRPVGNFLRALFENDLAQAATRADASNRVLLYEYVMFLYNYAPAGCWGDDKLVEKWAAHRGLAGIDSKDDARRI